MTEREAYVALNLVPSMGAVTVREGVSVFGSAAKFFAAGAGALSNLHGVGRVRAAAFAEAFGTVDWRGEMERAKGFSIKLVTFADDEYPEQLRSVHTPPLVLYVAGDPAALSRKSLAVVGTRAPTVYGRDIARSFSRRLSQAGLAIVSGLARGVDTEAAEGALEGGGKTIAVIGSALDQLYPAENRGLARRIVASGGAVVSEYPFGRKADKQTFPMRNRIVSGLSSGVLCVEAGVASGTLITADHALEQGRPVMAIPGRINDPSAQGCHKLIKNGARLVESPEEICEEIGFAPAAAATGDTKSATPGGTFSPEENKILAVLKDGEQSPDAVMARTALPPHIVTPLLLALEMKCAVRRTPGGGYALR